MLDVIMREYSDLTITLTEALNLMPELIESVSASEPSEQLACYIMLKSTAERAADIQIDIERYLEIISTKRDEQRRVDEIEPPWECFAV